MEAIVALIEAVVQLIIFVIHLGAMIVAGAVYGLLHGYAAVRSPSSNAKLRRLQLWTLAFLIPGGVIVIIAVFVMAYLPNTGIGLSLFLAGTVLLVVAGVIGERANRQDRSLTSNAD